MILSEPRMVLVLLAVTALVCAPAHVSAKNPERSADAGAARPDVLFIAVDDLNDWITLLDCGAPIRTPQLERLARRGVLFTRAYSASAACNPSRVAVLTGRRPSTTGVYGNRSDWRAALPDAVTLMQHFRKAGYRVEGAGKIFHHALGGRFHDAASFDDFQMMPDPPDRPMPKTKLNGLGWYGSPNTDWGPWPHDEARAIDVRTVDYCVARLKEKRTGSSSRSSGNQGKTDETDDRPLFLAAGIFRPHMPFFAPQPYFDLYPTAEVVMPVMKDDDLADIPTGGRALLKPKKWFFAGMMKAERQQPGTWRDAVRGYQACATFADAQIGRLLDALDACGRSRRTVIVLWADHGYHLGEKRHWEKFALWEKTTHVPFLIVAPGVAREGERCERPVDLMSIYPTLIELCKLKPRDDLDGVSIVPLLKNPRAGWSRPALTTYLRGNHAVRSERWRYIRYADGSEELYDHTGDPHEWNNLASDPDHSEVIATHRKWLPEKNAPQVRDMKISRSRKAAASR
jgi:arylsulfatase A-like enzyme